MNKRQERVIARKELWIGLAKVQQQGRNGVLGDADGAYTNAIAFANGRASFRTKVIKALAELNLSLIRLEDAETLRERLSKYAIDPELRSVTKAARVTERVCFGTFHAFEAE